MKYNLINYLNEKMKIGSKSFYITVNLFNKSIRNNILMLYNWCRYCDDIIDDQILGINNYLNRKKIYKNFKNLKKKTYFACNGIKMIEPSLISFQKISIKFNNIPKLAFEHLKGFYLDIKKPKFLYLNDTLNYCYYISGVVGLMIANILGIDNKSLLDSACDLGLAFQLTNISRDIIEDAKRGRCYIPQEWLKKEKIYKYFQIIDPTNRNIIFKIVKKLIKISESYYNSAFKNITKLSIRLSWIITSTYSIYRKIGVKIFSSGANAWDKRQNICLTEKFLLIIKSLLLILNFNKNITFYRSKKLWIRPNYINASLYYN